MKFALTIRNKVNKLLVDYVFWFAPTATLSALYFVNHWFLLAAAFWLFIYPAFIVAFASNQQQEAN